MMQRIEKFLPWCLLAGLIVFGGYVTLSFIGADGHITVLLSQEAWRNIVEHESSYFWRGFAGLLPFLKYLAFRLKPFTVYGVVCALLYGAYAVLQILRSGKLFLEIRLSLLHVLGISLGILWLFFTTLFYAPVAGVEQNVLIEPNTEVYEGVGEEGMTVLQQNFEHLLDQGCLTQDPTLRSKGNARVYSYGFFCMQKSFITRVMSQVGMLLFFLFDFLVLGKLLLTLLRLRSPSPLLDTVLSLGLGAAAVMFLLWCLALFGDLSLVPAWIILALIPLICYKQVLHWYTFSYRETWRYRGSFHALSIFLWWLLLSYLMFNFLTVIRPFPIGWDDLGKYINLPRQLSSMGTIIPGVLAIQWEYLTSLGFVLFGYSSTFGSVLAQQINWMAGLLAILAILVTTKCVLGNRAGVAAALFYYTLPMVGHFSFADMKTENAILMFGALGLTALFLFLSREGEEKPSRRWLFLAGIFFAAAFGTKPTILLLFMTGGIILTAGLIGNMSAIGVALLSFALFSKFGVLDLGTILVRALGFSHPSLPRWGILFFGISGLLFFCFPLIRGRWRNSIVVFHKYGLALLFLTAGFLVYAGPWMINNMRLSGRVAVSAALTAPNTVTPLIEYSEHTIPPDAPVGSRGLPPELEPDLTHERCIGTSREEELDRYWGFGTGFTHYLGVPWRVVMNKDSQGYYLVTSALLLLFPLLLLLPAFWKNRLLRLLFFGTALYVFQWIFSGNGIPWYGIGMFLGLVICIEALLTHAPDIFTRTTMGVLLFLSMATAFSMRMWQFDMQRNLYEYSWGKASADVLREMTIPDYDDVVEHVERLSGNPERPFLYRAGTFISYFIPRNLTVIVQNDNQLGFFNCLNQEEDHALTLRRLQALGFHSIVFDTNTATIEADPNGTLHQKVQRFINFANDPSLGITSVVNNPRLGIAYMILP
jgi:hypothetical protein